LKKLLATTLTILVMIGILASPAAAQEPITLLAGKYIESGNVAISTSGDNLTVTFETTDGWQMMETHLYVGTDVPDKSAPGRFPYTHEDLGGATADTYNLFLSELELNPGDTVYMAAQAALQKPVVDEDGNPVLDEEGNPVYLEESAWAEGDPIRPGKNWAMYFSFEVPATEVTAE